MTYHVKDLEAGPLLDQAVLRALGAVHVQDCPEGVPDNVRERWPAEGAMVLTDEDGNQMFYGMRNIPQFSTEWGVGGPLIEREGVSVQPWWGPDGARYPGPPLDWLAFTYRPRHNAMAYKPLVAACRALVLAKIGQTVELFDPYGFAKFGTASAVQGPPGTQQAGKVPPA